MPAPLPAAQPDAHLINAIFCLALLNSTPSFPPALPSSLKTSAPPRLPPTVDWTTETIYDPATTRLNPNFSPAAAASPTNPQYLRDPFPGNIIPASRIDPIARGILGYVDSPNSGALALGQARFLNNESVRQVWDQFSVRIDHSLSTKDQLFGRYSFSEESIFQPGGLTSQATRREPRPQIFTLGYTRLFSPQIANDVRTGFTRLRLNIVK